MTEWKRIARLRDKRDGEVYGSGRSINDDIMELLELGSSKRAIANLLDVSMTEVMRWHSTGVCLPDEQKKVNELLALCDLLQVKFDIPHPASFLEMHLVESCVIDMQEMYRENRADLVLDFASGRKTEEQVLEAYDPGWREMPTSLFAMDFGIADE